MQFGIFQKSSDALKIGNDILLKQDYKNIKVL